jgi:FkbM family methyltransferase
LNRPAGRDPHTPIPGHVDAAEPDDTIRPMNPTNAGHAPGAILLAVALLAGAGCSERHHDGDGSGPVSERSYEIGQAPRHAMIDGGAHRGETIENFKRHRIYRERPWEIFAWECNPDLAAALPKAPDVTVVPKAMWTGEGTLEFFVTDETTCSSVYEGAGHEKVPQKKRIEVPSADFGKWLLDGFKPEDWVILKLDIEGAEYPILDKMLADGSIDLVDMLFVEFHNEWVDVSKDRDRELREQIERRGVKVFSAKSHKDGDWF